MAATIKDLAKKTGLSLATISKYLNGGNVLPENRTLIKGAIFELGYSVNTIARGLKTKRSMTVGVLIPDLENVFCTTIVSHLENRLLKAGYSTLICNYQRSCKLEQEKFDFLAERQIDGMIVMPLQGYPQGIERLRTLDIPVVNIDRPVAGCKCDTVVINNMQISYLAVKKLLELGHRKIAIICGPEKIYTAKERLKGYYDAFMDYGLKPDRGLIRFGDYYGRSGYTHTISLMKGFPVPSALFVTNNEMTVGSTLALNELDIKLPADLSLIGFDNRILAEVGNPKLSVVMQPLKDIGCKAADILLQRIQEISQADKNKATDPRMYILNAVLLPGKTIAKPAVRFKLSEVKQV